MRYLERSIGLVLIFSFLLISLAIEPAYAGSEQDEAISNYHNGIAAKTIGEREQYFEKALEIYLTRYNTMKQQGEVNGLLCYHIGNCYFNLQHNEEAIFYFQLGKKLLPANRQINDNLAEAFAKRKNAIDVETGGIMESLLFFHYKLSPSQQVNTLGSAALLAAFSLTWLIIRPNITARYGSILSGITLICLLGSLTVQYYMPSHIGIVMKSSDVRYGAGSGFAPVTTRPLGGGSSIKVISLTDGWYSVKLNDGRQGFIKQENLKLIVI